ncbi:hypothetical protein RT41_GL001850 [Lactococcus fujiensis JCM 16395]|uniref:Uncharacterized protein n=1 Tax=Lactococcus fujiensis JCM 16395 TaxID=1291764 RepID=A0A2A5RJX1_9LACT|nr:hypothetical protein RT41_GL001850 [Lactococcus fujiensis JCM 16395]
MPSSLLEGLYFAYIKERVLIIRKEVFMAKILLINASSESG